MCIQTNLNEEAKFNVGDNVILAGNSDALEPYMVTARKKEKDKWVYQINHISVWIDEMKLVPVKRKN
jgi:hypothetical protein